MEDKRKIRKQQSNRKDAQGRKLAYDAWNRLVAVNDASATQVARYEHDGMNRRIFEQAGTSASPAAASAAVRDLFYSQEWQVLEERVRDAGGSIPATADTRYVWSPVYIDAMVARDRNADSTASTGISGLEERVYVLQDANSNTTRVVAASGVPGVSAGLVINRFAYTPYGEPQTLTDSWATPSAGSTPATPWSHLFQGLKFTDVTGLAYVRHRGYSPPLGRFIERDLIGFEAGDNNWYRFVANGPTETIDPSGLDWGSACRDYWYYLTHPWAMDDELEYGFYGCAAVAGTCALGAGGVVLVGGSTSTGVGTLAGAAPLTGAGMPTAHILAAFFNGQQLANNPTTVAALRWYQQVARDAIAKYAAMGYGGPGIETQTARLQQIAQQLQAWGVE
jgi:RHS repeat-associated protein